MASRGRGMTPVRTGWVVAALVCLPTGVLAVEAASAAQGQALYYGSAAFNAEPRAAGAPLPRGEAACVKCHGALGQGRSEGAVSAPDIRWPALTARGLDAAALQRALRDGLLRDGRPLAAAMPRYALQASEWRALFAYWQQLGQESAAVSGVDDGELRLGIRLAGLPSPGARLQVQQGVQQAFDQVNAAGGVHGRQLRLLRWDSDSAPPAVLALVASMPEPQWREQLARRRLPSLAALSIERSDVAGDDWTVPLLPSLQQQIRLGVQAVQDAGRGCTVWVLDPHGLARDEAAALPPAPPAPTAATPWAAEGVCLLSLASATETTTWLSRAQRVGASIARVVELDLLRGRDVAEPTNEPITDESAALSQVRTAMPPVRQWVTPTPLALLEHARSQQRSTWQELGAAAAAASIEALARAGRVLQPELVLEHFRGLTGYEPIAGAPIVLGRTRSHAWEAALWSATAPEAIITGRTP